MSDLGPTTPADRTPPPTATPTSPPPSRPTTPPPASSGTKGGKKGKGAAAKDDPLRRSRTSGLWIGVIAAGLLLILLIIFIVQNTQTVTVKFLGWTGTPPLAAALLVAVAAGILVTALVGSLRILQLRRRVKRLSK